MAMVLIIDDNDLFREMLKQLLENAGYDVVIATDGNSGLKQFHETNPNLVVCDLIMPDREGLETIRTLREIQPDIPIIAVSGGGRIGAETYLQLAELMGARMTFTKPLVNSEFLEAVAECL
jgi:CheY-like chemotaxis protein